MRQFLLKICMLLLAIHAAPVMHAHAGGLSGKAQWNYVDYKAEEGGREVRSANHFWHEYSLMYRTKGNILDGRGGGWNLGFGGQWVGLDADFDGDISEQRFKPLYNGRLLLAPGGMPFRLNIYHRDRRRSYVTSERGSIPVSPTFIEEARGLRPNIFDPDIATTIHNGNTIETGATLMIGIRNGSYLGRYRNILSTLPRLLMDYRQVLVKDLRAADPVHYRQRELAFVSLNKKDNWFHYRYADYRDYLNSENNYTEKQYILGTITPEMRRHWIQMTNWIAVSVDGTFTQTTKRFLRAEEDAAATGTLEPGGNEKSNFAINLIGNARRSRWQGSSQVAFSRGFDQFTNDIDKSLFVPVYLVGQFDTNTAWRFRFEAEQEDLIEGVDEDRLYTLAHIDAFRTQRRNLTADLEVETRSGINGDSNTVRLGLELFSNSQFRAPLTYLLGYDLAYFSSSSDSREATFWENSARISLTSRVSSRTNWGVSQSLTYGTGTLERQGSDSIKAVVGGSLLESENNSDQTSRSGDVLRSTTTIYGEHTLYDRHVNRLELNYDHLTEDAGTERQLTTKYRYSYRNRKLLGEVRSIYRNIWADGDRALKEFSLRGELQYHPTRTLEAEISLDYDRSSRGPKSSNSLTSEETLQYTFYKINGLIRKLWQLTQLASYEILDSNNGGRREIETYSLAAAYYPWQVLALSGGVRLERFSPADTDRLIYDFGCRFTMSKLKASLTYSYGTQGQDDPTLADRNEQRLELNVERIF